MLKKLLHRYMHIKINSYTQLAQTSYHGHIEGLAIATNHKLHERMRDERARTCCSSFTLCMSWEWIFHTYIALSIQLINVCT